MHNEDLDGLAAEYVLGTLAAGARVDADRLIQTDPAFAGVIHKWERRLGAINVTAQTAPAPEPASEAAREESEAARAAKDEAAAAAKAEQANNAAGTDDGNEPAQGAVSAPPLSPQGEPEAHARSAAQPAPRADVSPPAALQAWPAAEPRVRPWTPAQAAESPQLVSLSRRLRRWRLATAACGLLALGLAASRVPRAQAPAAPNPRAPLPAATRPPPVARLIAVLQQEPSAPAFLLTIDPATRTLTVRRVAAKPQAGHSYELWVRPAHGKPRTLGVVGAAQYTQRPLPSGFDINAMRGARYEISFEPTGGSKNGAPGGPILFTGTLLEAARPPAARS